MISITDKSHQPSMAEIDEYIGDPLFGELCAHMDSQYSALRSVEYSGDNVLLGWNVKFHKAGRTLIRAYPKRGYFSVLVVVGRKEKERAEALLPKMSESMRKIYESTQEGMGQRWLLIDLNARDELYNDVLALVRLRRGR